MTTVFHARPYGKFIVTQSNLRWAKPLMLFSFIVVLSFSAEIRSSGLTLHVYLTILASSLSYLITFSYLTGQVSFPYRIALCTHAKCTLPFAPKSKLLVNKGTKSRNLHHPLLILNCTPTHFNSSIILLIRRDLCFYNQTNKYNIKII